MYELSSSIAMHAHIPPTRPVRVGYLRSSLTLAPHLLPQLTCRRTIWLTMAKGQLVYGRVWGDVRNPNFIYTAPTWKRLQVVAVATYWCLLGGDGYLGGRAGGESE